MRDAAARFRRIEHIHNRAVLIGDGQLRAAAPKRFEAEQIFFFRVLQRKLGSMIGLLFMTHFMGCKNEDATENLFREIVVARRRPSADITGTEK